jgi:hypothetical protein
MTPDQIKQMRSVQRSLNEFRESYQIACHMIKYAPKSVLKNHAERKRYVDAINELLIYMSKLIIDSGMPLLEYSSNYPPPA